MPSGRVKWTSTYKKRFKVKLTSDTALPINVSNSKIEAGLFTGWMSAMGKFKLNWEKLWSDCRLHGFTWNECLIICTARLKFYVTRHAGIVKLILIFCFPKYYKCIITVKHFCNLPIYLLFHWWYTSIFENRIEFRSWNLTKY